MRTSAPALPAASPAPTTSICWPSCTARRWCCTPTMRPRSCCRGSMVCWMPARSTSRATASRCSARTCWICRKSRSHENIEICKRYLERMSKMGMTLEIELGVTGGEEDGVDNSGVDSSKLYTQPEDVAQAYEELSKVSPRFTIAAAFGNVHGVYKPGNVKLQPVILKNSQEYVPEEIRHQAPPDRLRLPRRLGLDARGNPRGDLLRRGQDEHRHRPAMGVLGRRQELLQEERRLSARTDRQSRRRRTSRTRSTTTRGPGCARARKPSRPA